MSISTVHQHCVRSLSLDSESEKAILALQRPDFIVGSIHDQEVIDNVVDKVSQNGIAIGGFNETVCYVIGRPTDGNFLDSIIKLKGGERSSMALALTHTADIFTPYVDLNAIPSQMLQYFEDPVLMEETFGQLAFLRVPVKKNFVQSLPSTVVSGAQTNTPLIQNWIPTNAMETLVRQMEQKGMLVGITSLNRHGAGPTFNQIRGAQLASQYLGAYLYDQRYPNDISAITNNGKPKLPFGSYPIIEIGRHLLNKHRVSLVRHGPFDHRAIVALFPGKGIEVDLSMREANSIDFPDEIIQEIEKVENPQQVRLMIISFLKGLLT